jgi:hypothetical protein
LAALSQEFQLGKTQMSSLLEEVQMRLERQLSERAGHIVAAPTNTNLRYWIGAFGTKSSKR